MIRELLILRHGKSDWDAHIDDLHRPLTDGGKRSAQRIGTWLMRQRLVPDYVISSPAVRALETARKACKAMGRSARDIIEEPGIYLASRRAMVAELEQCPEKTRRVMLVGHNPGLEDLLKYLAGSTVSVPSDDHLLHTATLARLGMPESWRVLRAGCANLIELVQPDSLPTLFPFPAPDGEELRKRPAYYYSQSSVIPFRKTRNGIEILVVSSSKKKHYVVPKGIHDPGMTAEASAAKEAWEEAGVEGKVLGKRLGEYVYRKWGADCTVRVFPMRVERMVPEKEWKESHRGREWVSPSRAKARLKQKALAPMVDELVRRYG